MKVIIKRFLRGLIPGCLPLLLCFFTASCRTAGRSGGSPAADGRGAAGVAHAEVRGNSLTPLLNNGDSVKIYYGFYDTHEVQRGDIVVCRFSFRQDPVIKLARAVPGDNFALKELPEGGVLLLINGAVLENSAGRPYKFTGKRKQMLSLYVKDYEGVIPENSYLLLGNIAEGSLDSSRFGLADREVIIGKAMR